MKRSVLLAVWCMSCAAVASAQVQVSEAKYTDAAAPLVMDGDLAEWDALSLPKIGLDRYQSLTNESSAPASGDLSGWFSCIADNSNLYVAVNVTDDVVVTGNHEYGRGWMDDVVEVCFDGDLLNTSKDSFDVNDGQVIVVGENGALKWLEGLVPGLIAQIPYYWDARGVRAGYRLTDTGYSVEIMLPMEILGKTSLAGQRIGLNVRVLEDDNQAAGNTQGVLSWAYDPELTSSWKTERYNQVAFNELIEIPQSAVYDTTTNTTAVSVGAQEMIIDLGSTDTQTLQSVMTTVHEKLHAKEWTGAIDALEPVGEHIWAKSMMGATALHNKDFKNAVAWLDEYAVQAGDGIARDWALNYLREFVLDMIFSEKYKLLFERKPFAVSAYVLNEHLRRFPADTQALSALHASLASSDTLDADSFTLFEEIVHSPASPDIVYDVKLAVARGHYCNGDFDRAKQLAEELVDSGADSRVILDARMILMSMPSPQ